MGSLGTEGKDLLEGWEGRTNRWTFLYYTYNTLNSLFVLAYILAVCIVVGQLGIPLIT